MVVLRLIFVSLFLFHSLSLCSKLLLQQNMNFSALTTVRLSVELKNTFILISYILTDFNMDEFAFLNFLLFIQFGNFHEFCFLAISKPIFYPIRLHPSIDCDLLPVSSKLYFCNSSVDQPGCLSGDVWEPCRDHAGSSRQVRISQSSLPVKYGAEKRLMRKLPPQNGAILHLDCAGLLCHVSPYQGWTATMRGMVTTYTY